MIRAQADVRSVAALVCIAAVSAIPLVGCAADGPGLASLPAARAPLVVFVAASVAVPFEELATGFEAGRPDLDVQLAPASSATLAQQIAEGAPAGVFASAAAGPMGRTGGRAVDPRVFATDDLVIAVPAGNPAAVAATADLARRELRLGLCAVGVPCGDYARQVLADAGVEASVDTDEPDAASLLAKVRSGDLDAAILYRSQVAAVAPMVEAVEVDPPSAVLVEYLISPLRTPDASPPSVDAVAFVEYVLGPGATVLASAGLGAP